jgi:hypothetical protein
MTDAIILPNAGSASLKFGAYGVDATKTLPLLCRGQIDSMRGGPELRRRTRKAGLWTSTRGARPGDQSRDSLAVRDHSLGIQEPTSR